MTFVVLPAPGGLKKQAWDQTDPNSPVSGALHYDHGGCAAFANLRTILGNDVVVVAG